MTTDKPSFSEEPRAAFGVVEFCRRNGICRGTLYNYWKHGIGPRYHKARGRRLITVQAEQDWHREQEAATAAEVAAGCLK